MHGARRNIILHFTGAVIINTTHAAIILDVRPTLYAYASAWCALTSWQGALCSHYNVSSAAGLKKAKLRENRY